MRLTYVSVLRELVATRALLTTEDADAFLRSCGAPASKHRLRTRNRALAALCATGELVRVQRGLYARGRPDRAPDPYSVASWLAPDAVLGLCSALEIHGVIAPQAACCIYFTRLDDAGRGPVWRGKRMQRIHTPSRSCARGRSLWRRRSWKPARVAACASPRSSARSWT